MELSLIFFSMIFLNNIVFTKLLGIETATDLTKRPLGILKFGLSVTIFMLLATAISWPIYTFILLPLGVEYLSTMLFVLVAALLFIGVDFAFKKLLPKFNKTDFPDLRMVLADCALLGIVFINMQETSFLAALIAALGAGIGLIAAMIIFYSIHRKLALANPPAAFHGAPLLLISASIVSLAFMGFGGLFENIFRI